MTLEFTYHVEPDENGVFDGRELARQLIGNAYRLLVPYVKACPACTDSLFSAIANLRALPPRTARGPKM
jgi:hypothetical protein